MKRIKVRIKGTTPLLQHRMRDDELFSLLGTKTNKKKDKEVKTPREIAESYAYKNEHGFVVPSSYICGAFRQVASEYKQNNSVRKSLKSIAGGIFRPETEFIQLISSESKPISAFEVDVKKATNHSKGAIAVCRPRFDEWELEFVVNINDDLVSQEVVLDVLNDAGKRSGIGSYRVSKGGYFGQFQVTSFEELKI